MDFQRSALVASVFFPKMRLRNRPVIIDTMNSGMMASCSDTMPDMGLAAAPSPSEADPS